MYSWFTNILFPGAFNYINISISKWIKIHHYKLRVSSGSRPIWLQELTSQISKFQSSYRQGPIGVAHLFRIPFIQWAKGAPPADTRIAVKDKRDSLNNR